MTQENKIFFRMSYFLFEVPNLQLMVVTVLGWQGMLVLVYTGLIVT